MIIQELDKRIIEISKITKNKNVLDLGCGINKYKKYFIQNNKFLGLDVKSSSRDSKLINPDQYYDGVKIPYDSLVFDIIICIEVLEHVKDIKNFLNEINRCLKIGGTLILSCPFITAEHDIPMDFRRMTSYGIKQELESYNFSILKHEKILYSVSAIRQLTYGEMLRFENSNKVNLFVKFFIKTCFRILFRILDKFYTFERLFFSNYVEAKKINGL